MYKPISREQIKIKGYTPRFTSFPEEDEPIIVKSSYSYEEPESPTIPFRYIDEIESSQEDIPEYSGAKYESFTKAYKNSGVDPSRFNFFSKLAHKESNFDHYVQNRAGAPAYGYFQFMQGSARGRTWNNIRHYAGVDTTTFRNSPELQIKAADKLANEFLRGFSEKDRQKARELGYTDSALLAGAWLGGVGGVRTLLYSGRSASDRSWSKQGKGSDVKTYMDEFNNMFKSGGIIKAEKGQAEIKPDNRNWLQKQWDKILTSYNTSTFVDSAPAQVLADFTPFGLFHYSAEGDPDTARLAMLPAGVETEKLLAAAKTGVQSVYSHYADDFGQYFLKAMKKLRNNLGDVPSWNERLDVLKKIFPENVKIGSPNHKYAMYKNAAGDTVLEVGASVRNPEEIGRKAASKQFLQELVGSKEYDKVRQLSPREQRLFRKVYAPNGTFDQNAIDIYAQLTASKVDLGIKSSFEALTESEAKRLFDHAWDHHLFVGGNKELFWSRNKNILMNIFKRLPAIAGIGVVTANLSE